MVPREPFDVVRRPAHESDQVDAVGHLGGVTRLDGLLKDVCVLDSDPDHDNLWVRVAADAVVIAAVGPNGAMAKNV